MPDSTQSPTEAMAFAKELSLRFERNSTALKSVRLGLEYKRNVLVALRKQKVELDADIARLEVEIPLYEKRNTELEAWCAKHGDLPEVSKQAEEIAKKIAKLTKEITERRAMVHRLEVGLPTDET